MARIRRQAAVIAYRIRKARVEVALVSRARGKGWIVPKGSIGEGERPRDAAIREAEEEAGLRGIVARRRVGRYRHENGDGSYLVDVYLMRVTRVLDEWDEDRFRRRRWLRAEDAAARLRAELQAFVERLERTLGSQR
jgi:8-oxo-dGTP pyrophosphatase MutT (NUDIX family)